MNAHNKKILSLAVAAALSGASFGAHAVVNLGTSTTGVKFASELPITGLDLFNGTTIGGTDLSFSAVPTTFSPSAGQNLLVTVSLTGGSTFSGAPNLSCVVSAATGAAFAVTAGNPNLGGNGTSTAVFTLGTATIDAVIGSGFASLTSACTVSASAITVASGAHSTINASITYQYGSLASSTVSTALITFVKGVSAYVSAGTNQIAQVTAGFTQFAASATTGSLGYVFYAGNGSARIDSSGIKASALDVMTAAAASITLDGAAGALAAGMTGGVYLVTAGHNCVTANVLASANGAASVTLGTTAGVTVGQLATGGYQACLTVNGTTAIPADSITATLTANSTVTGYSANTSISPNALMTITRDGTTMVAPLVQIPAGWLSRLVITNAGTAAAAYTVAALGETGNTVTLTGAAASGTVPANSVTIVDLPALMTATGTVRGSLVATVAGTTGNISGVYQLVNPTGSLSNYTMLNK